MIENRRPMVSIVMPVYNSARYLEEAVDSLMAQTCQDFELIAVDDGSTDESGHILDRYADSDSRIRVIHQANGGISAARNRGMREARGKYIAVMDSDDVCLPNRLERQIAFMESRPEVGLSGSRCSFFGDGGEHLGVRPALEPEQVRSRLLFLPTLSHTSVIMRRDLVTAHDLYYDEDFPVAEDYELYTRFIQHSRIANLPDVLMRIRTHGDSTTRRLDGEGDRRLRMVYARVIPQLGIHPTPDEIDLHLSISVCRFERSRDYVEQAEQWLCRLLEANKMSGFCSGKTFARTLFERWFSVCATQYEFGLWILRKLVRSRLYTGHFGLSRICLGFAARCLLKRQSLRQWRKRRIQSTCQEV